MKNKLLAYTKLLFLFSIIIIFNTCEKEDDNDDDVISTKFTITPEGGEYEFENGIKFNVPNGAVSEETEIEIKYAEMTDDNIISIFNKRGITSDDCYAIIEALPDGLTFDKPVTVILPVDLVEGAFPTAYEYDLENGTYTPSITNVSYNLDEGIIEFSLSHFSTHSVEQVKELKKGEEYCKENPCKCKNADIKQSDNDVICNNGDCQATDFTVTANYPECGGSTEMYIVSEISDGCEPELTLSADRVKIPAGEQTDITAVVDFICSKLPSQEVTFSVDALGTLSSGKEFTDDNGKAKVTFTAGDEEGTATITVKTIVKYSKSIIYSVGADGLKGKEENSSEEISKEVTKTINITIEPIEEQWSGTFIVHPYSEMDPGGCFYETLSEMKIDFTMQLVYEGKASDQPDGSLDYWGDTYVRLFVGQYSGSATQDLSIESGSSDDCWIENFSAPSSLSIHYVVFLFDTNNIALEAPSESEYVYNYFFFTEPYFNFDWVMLDVDGNEVRIDDCAEQAITPLLENSNIIELKEGEQNGTDLLYVWSNSANYTLSFTKKKNEENDN